MTRERTALRAAVWLGAALIVGACGTTAQTAQCQDSQTDCGGTCVDTASDRDDCGACGTTCAAGQACSNGACVTTCPAGQTLCDEGGGVVHCASLEEDRSDCGACGTVCEAGNVCSNGTCALSCQAGLIECAGKCIDPKDDRAYCGASLDCQGANAGVSCGRGEICANGECALSCPADRILCDGTCIDPDTDRNHCGADGSCLDSSAGVACGDGEVCKYGSCEASCAAPLTVCGNACVDTRFEPDNCGSCGTGCAAGSLCDNGACAAPSRCANNLALSATPSVSGGGTSAPYLPTELNNGVRKVCTGYSWVIDGTTPSGAWFEYDWSVPQTIGSIYVETEGGTGLSVCSNFAARNVASATVEYWNGAQWLTAGSFSGMNGDFGWNLPTPVTTSRLRLYDVTAVGQNSIIYEWFVYDTVNCYP